MNLKSQLLLVFLFPIFLSAQVEDRPTYEEIITHFFSNRKAPVVVTEVNFECRPEGYVIKEVERGGRELNRELYYDFEKKQYLPIKLYSEERVKPYDAKRAVKDYLRKTRWRANNFKISPYFGYRGWYNDVIAFYESKEEMSDWDLNALARAYKTKAVSLIADYTGMGVEAERFDLPMGRNSMTSEQVNKYLALHWKELEIYEKLMAQNPNFETPVGPIQTKYANNAMDAFLQLLIHQNEETAMQVLKEDLYDDYLLKAARNMLRSCPPNSVLITYGDTDTYPLYYVQAKEGFRRDVIVANSSLMQTPRYLSLVYEGSFGAKPLKTILPKTIFESFIMFGEKPLNDMGLVTFEQLAERMHNEAGFQERESGAKVYYVESDSLFMPVHPSAKSLDINKLNQLSLDLNGSFFGSELAMWDILWSNNWQRPVCFSMTCRSSTYRVFEKNLVQEGIVYRVYPNELMQIAYLRQGEMDVATTYDKFINDFEWNASAKITDSDKAPISQIYFVTGWNLAKKFHESGEVQKQKTILDFLVEKIPNEARPWDTNWIHIAKEYAKSGDLAFAEKMGQTITQNYLDGTIEPKDDFQKARIKLALQKFVEAYEMEALKKVVEKIEVPERF